MTELRDIAIEAITKDILTTHSPGKSSCGFAIRYGEFTVLSPDYPVSIRDDDLLEWYEQTFKMSYSAIASKEEISYEAYRESSLREAHRFKKREFVGGYGVTDRPLSEIEEAIPSITRALLSASGKVAFLGNGLSLVPLILSDRYKSGLLDTPPIIVDMFSYGDLVEDFQSLETAFAKNQIPTPYYFEELATNARKLQGSIADGSLKAVNYYIGIQQPPAEIQGLSLAINCHGPKESSFNDQLSLLSVDGSLYTTRPSVRLPSNFTRTPLLDSQRAAKITRTR